MRIVKMRKGTWSKEEDEFLVKHVKKQIEAFQARNQVNGTNECLHNIKLDWVDISLGVQTRTGKQCRERWINHLDPDLKKSRWTQEEDKKLLELGEKYPSKWAIISRKLVGRSQNQVKIRWNTLNNTNRKGTKRKLLSNATGHFSSVVPYQQQSVYSILPVNPTLQMQPTFPNVLPTSQFLQQQPYNIFGYGSSNGQLPILGLPGHNLFSQQTPTLLPPSFYNIPISTPQLPLSLGLGQTQQFPQLPSQLLPQPQRQQTVNKNRESGEEAEGPSNSG